MSDLMHRYASETSKIETIRRGNFLAENGKLALEKEDLQAQINRLKNELDLARTEKRAERKRLLHIQAQFVDLQYKTDNGEIRDLTALRDAIFD